MFGGIERVLYQDGLFWGMLLSITKLNIENFQLMIKNIKMGFSTPIKGNEQILGTPFRILGSSLDI